MNIRPFARQSAARRRHRQLLLISVSALTLIAPQAPAQASPLLHPSHVASPPGAAAASALSAAQQAATQTQRARDSLLRSTQAMQAMQAAQDAARSLAKSGPNNLGMDPRHPGKMLPNVPDGLAPGGLVPDTGLAGSGTANPTDWVNAQTPVQSSSGGQITVSIQQTAKQAILSWNSFNVGQNTIVHFQQGGGAQPDGSNDWIALNRINDPTGVPSQILGSIRAEGQVYLINRNGIIFGGSSQVSINTLIASSLDITDQQFKSGILSHPANQSQIQPSFLGTPGDTATVTVQPGASIETQDGGKVLLLGGNVTNGGSILTPRGQTILAAGEAVYLQDGADPQTAESGNVRGIVANVDSGIGVNRQFVNGKTVFTRQGPGSDATAINAGTITAAQGNITLVGQNVTQDGVLTATSSATLDGSIKLWARSGTFDGPNR